MRGRVAVGWAALVAALVVAGPAGAEPTKCRREINKAAIGYAQKVERAVESCKRNALAKGVGLDQPDSFARCSVTSLKTPPASAISKAADKMRAAIVKKCGGPDKSCAATSDNDPLAAINWNVGTCMGFASAGVDCTNAIAHCGDVGTCLECMVDQTVERLVDGLVFDGFNPASFFPNNAEVPGKVVAKCQGAVAKQAGKLLSTRLRTVQKCWDQKLKEKAGFDDADPCPETDVKTGTQLLAAEQKQVAGICAKCGGGGDKDKNAACDASALPIGGVSIAVGDVVETPFVCADVQVPGSGEDCSDHNPVDTLQKYVDCLDCQLEFKADCLSFAVLGDGSAGATQGITYPTACRGL